MAETDRETLISLRDRIKDGIVEPSYSYLILNSNIDIQKEIFEMALNKNRILLDIYERETYVYTKCYKIDPINLKEAISNFLSFKMLFVRYENHPINIAWRAFLRYFYIKKVTDGEEMKAKNKGE